MKFVGFVEGVRRNEPGIVCVPTILKSVAAQGHSAVLLIGGLPSLGAERFFVPDAHKILARQEGSETFGVVSLKAWTHWKFCPSILWRFNRLVRESDFVTLHSLYTFPVLAGYILARIHRKPYGIFPHGVLATFQRQVGVRKKWVYNKLFADRILKNASVIFFSAEGERDEAAALGLRTPSVIIPDGFDAESFSKLPERGAFRERFLSGHSGPLILFLARLNAKKGLDLLITSMKRVLAERPDARLAIVGPPDPPSFHKRVLQWLKESNIESETVLTGMADQRMRLEAYADADVYVLPSHAENFGHSVFEAMCCGVPIVVSDTLNFAEAFRESGAGLVLPRTPEAFSNAIVSLINDSDLRHEMGDCGRSFSHRYSLEATGAKVAAAAESILHRKQFSPDLAPMMGDGFPSWFSDASNLRR
jgi:glycosyltransferase involved in cell wall biosynthesis